MVAVQLLQPRLIVHPSHRVERYSIGPSPGRKSVDRGFELTAAFGTITEHSRALQQFVLPRVANTA